MKTLDEIMLFYGTDKASIDCNYTFLYENILESKRNEKLKILEIGIFRQPPSAENRPLGDGRRLTAASLKSWHDYLPNSMIYGIDLHDFTDVDNDRIKTLICNQESKEELTSLINKIGSEFDLIIDDGGHMMNQHQISLGSLFKHLKKGGVYVIEDLLTCHMPHYVRGDKTTLTVLNEFIETGKIDSKYIDEKETKYLEENIKNIEIHNCRLSEIALIFKK